MKSLGTMMSKTKMAACVLSALSLCVGVSGGARADDSEGYALAYVGVGVMLVNTGAAVANGIALIADNPSRSNGMFGLVLGGATVGLSAIGFAAADGDDVSENFSLALGVCGIAAAVTGYLNVRGASASPAGSISGRKIAIRPSPRVNRSGASAWGLVIEMDF